MSGGAIDSAEGCGVLDKLRLLLKVGVSLSLTVSIAFSMHCTSFLTTVRVSNEVGAPCGQSGRLVNSLAQSTVLQIPCATSAHTFS